MRIDKFNSLRDHPWLGRLFIKLRAKEVVFAANWILEHEHLDAGQFEMATNRMFMDRADLRNEYKNWPIILELVANSNENIFIHQGGKK